ncbi:MAG: 3-oxoacyl-ACP synthase III [Pirellulaceae bacterium]
MRFQNVFIESIGYVTPSELWTSDDVEQKLLPLYERLKLPFGRLQMMTGIETRGFWPAGTRPSQLSVVSAQHALNVAEIDPRRIGLMIHGSVCRDFLEPATACTVHHQLNLPDDCVIYDVSNACLGILNGMLQAANMIELNQIEAAIVVGSEGGRQLVETTIAALNRDQSLTRKSIKDAIASLTIGSASCAILLTNRERSRSKTQLQFAAVKANTRWNHLCQSDHDQAGANFQPLMATDSNELLQQGVQTGVMTFEKFLETGNWTRADIDHSICHQVGVAHQKLMLDSLGLPIERDFATYPILGNTGSAALPISLGLAAEAGFLKPDSKVALLGIGSGINSIMIGCNWQNTFVRGSKF